MPNNPDNAEIKRMIEKLIEQVKTAERRGHFNTVHHQMLTTLLSKEKKYG